MYPDVAVERTDQPERAAEDFAQWRGFLYMKFKCYILLR